MTDLQKNALSTVEHLLWINDIGHRPVDSPRPDHVVSTMTRPANSHIEVHPDGQIILVIKRHNGPQRYPVDPCQLVSTIKSLRKEEDDAVPKVIPPRPSPADITCLVCGPAVFAKWKIVLPPDVWYLCDKCHRVDNLKPGTFTRLIADLPK